MTYNCTKVIMFYVQYTKGTWHSVAHAVKLKSHFCIYPNNAAKHNGGSNRRSSFLKQRNMAFGGEGKLLQIVNIFMFKKGRTTNVSPYLLLLFGSTPVSVVTAPQCLGHLTRVQKVIGSTLIGESYMYFFHCPMLVIRKFKSFSVI